IEHDSAGPRGVRAGDDVDIDGDVEEIDVTTEIGERLVERRGHASTPHLAEGHEAYSARAQVVPGLPARETRLPDQKHVRRVEAGELGNAADGGSVVDGPPDRIVVEHVEMVVEVDV